MKIDPLIFASPILQTAICVFATYILLAKENI